MDLLPSELNTMLRLVAACGSDPQLLDDAERFRHVSGFLPPRDAELLCEGRGLLRSDGIRLPLYSL